MTCKYKNIYKYTYIAYIHKTVKTMPVVYDLSLPLSQTRAQFLVCHNVAFSIMRNLSQFILLCCFQIIPIRMKIFVYNIWSFKLIVYNLHDNKLSDLLSNECRIIILYTVKQKYSKLRAYVSVGEELWCHSIHFGPLAVIVVMVAGI